MVVRLKKATALFAIIILSLSISGCNFDLHNGKRPYDYDNAEWASSTPEISFFVDWDKEDHYSPEGTLEVDGIVFDIKIYFVTGTNIVFIDTVNTDQLLSIEGHCEFYPDKLVVVVDEDQIFNNQYKEIIFYRIG